MQGVPERERRRYRRLLAPTVSRPVSWFALRRRPPLNGLGPPGFRTYSDERHEEGERLEVEVLLPDGESATVAAEVAWVEPLPEGSPARFDVGLRLLGANPGDVQRISAVLGEP